MILYIYITCALINAALWARVFVHYLRRWKLRGNPESMAICTSVVVMGGESFGRLWYLYGSVSYLNASLAFTAIWIVAAGWTLWSIRRARQKFIGTREGDR